MKARGFTLIELMITVAIVGILAAVAIPMFLDAIKKSKTSEVRVQLHKMMQATRTYYVQNSSFPGTIAITPNQSCCFQNYNNKKQCQPVHADWAVPTWQALDFEITEGFYFQYLYANLGNVFVAEAFGDLDCDGVFSFYEAVGQIDANGNLAVQYLDFPQD
jgi:prepilin-type N-terminal cleavage/methylation domain-containing protein